MLREEQIDIRRQRAAQSKLVIQNVGRNRIFSDYQVTNPATGGQYQVSIRGFDVGDNACTCPDYRTNTLRTCKHIEAVLAHLSQEAPAKVRHRKAAVTQAEVYLDYGDPMRPGLHLPPRHSDRLSEVSAAFFDGKGLWNGQRSYDDLIESLSTVPEPVTVHSDAMEFMEREIERREMAAREKLLVERLEQGKFPLDDLLTVPLYPYQARGALFLAFRGRCILGDDMGLGKTVQTMAAVELLAREQGVDRVLVVSPASVKYQWETEIRKFTRRPVQVVDGGRAARLTQYGQPTFYRLINYETVLRDLDALNAWQPDLIVLDEAQRIKNWESKVSRAVKKLRSKYAIVLTGTPLENTVEELYSIVAFVDDRRLGPAFQFLHDHRLVDESGKLLGYRNLDALREKLEPILLRRTRAEVLSQLPGRTDNVLYVEMSEPQRALYGDQHYALVRLINKKYLTEMDRRRIMCCITNMRMVCDSTYLMDKQTHVSPKLDEFRRLLDELLSTGPRKVVVFSQWEMMLREAAAVLDDLQVGYTMLHGGVPGKDRRALLDQFRDDPACRVFLSTDAGGTGLNLQSADTVVNLEVPWNPAVLEQRIARVHRMGQHRPVQVFNLVTRNSIEERVVKTVALKKSLFDGVFNGTSDEVSFAALGRQAFLDTVRDVVSEAEKRPEPPPPAPTAVGPDPRQAALTAGVQFLEALAHLFVTANGDGKAAVGVTTDAKTGQPVLQVPLPPPEVMQRGAAALQVLLQHLAPPAK